MRFSTIIAVTLLGGVSALPGPAPIITTAPELPDITSADAVAHHNSTACTSTDCWASYAECNGSLTFVYLCYTPPPCGTVTSPEPFKCPPPTTSHAGLTAPTIPAVPMVSAGFTASPTFATSTVSS